MLPKTQRDDPRAGPYSFVSQVRLDRWGGGSTPRKAPTRLPPIDGESTTAAVASKSPTTKKGHKGTTPRAPTVDTSKRFDKGLVADRESHTADIAAFDRYVSLMQNASRGPGAPELNVDFWAKLRELVTGCAGCGYTDAGDANSTIAMAPTAVGAFMHKFEHKSSMIFPLNPAVLANTMSLPATVIFDELLYATKVGLVGMKWAPECTKCGAAVCRASELAALPAKDDCENCGAPNTVALLDKVMVLFEFTPEVFYAPSRVTGCVVTQNAMAHTELLVPVPATASGSGFTHEVGTENGVRPPIAKGTYDLVCPINNLQATFVVERDAKESDEPVEVTVRMSALLKQQSANTTVRPVVAAAHGKMKLTVHSDDGSFCCFWALRQGCDPTAVPAEERMPYMSAQHALHDAAFQRLFGSQVVSTASVIEVRKVVLVFTDVVGSTAMYAREGDGHALRLVQEHFEILFRHFSRRGRVVKTVGDAVMASFTTGADAIESVAAAIQELAGACDGKVRIRVGCHAGAAVVVPLNGINDFFGQTVNVSARVEGTAPPMGLAVTEAVLADPAAQQAFHDTVASSGGALERLDDREVVLKGVPEPVKTCTFAALVTH